MSHTVPLSVLLAVGARHVPLSRVLLESDLEDGQGLEQGLRQACHAIAEAYNQQQHQGGEEGDSGAAGGGGALTAADVARVTEDNARRFFFQSGQRNSSSTARPSP